MGGTLPSIADCTDSRGWRGAANSQARERISVLRWWSALVGEHFTVFWPPLRNALEQLRADQLSKPYVRALLVALKKSQALQRANNFATW